MQVLGLTEAVASAPFKYCSLVCVRAQECGTAGPTDVSMDENNVRERRAEETQRFSLLHPLATK